MSLSFNNKLILRIPRHTFNSSFDNSDEIRMFLTEERLESIFLASKNLYHQSIKWLSGGLDDKDEEDRFFLSIRKYATRMTKRTTPFGLFAACGVVNWGDRDSKSEIIVDTNNFYSKTRLDMGVMNHIINRISNLDYIRPFLTYHQNNSIYKVGDRIRYVEYNDIKDNRLYQISSIDSSDYINLILDFVKNGAKINEIVELLVFHDIEYEEALNFVNELIENKIIISDMEFSLTGGNLINQLIKILKSLNSENTANVNHLILNLEQIQDLLIQLDENKISYFDSQNIILKKLSDWNFELDNLFQVDLFFNPKEKIINKKIQKNILSAIHLMYKVYQPDVNDPLLYFKQEFVKRYGDSEIPLLFVLDSEVGVGFGNLKNKGLNPLLEGLDLRYKSQSRIDSIPLTTFQSFLLKKLGECLRQNESVIEIHDKYFEKEGFHFSGLEIPKTSNILFERVNDYEGNEFTHLKGLSGPSALNLIGRFSSDDVKIKELAQDIADFEKTNNSLLASILHFPEGRDGNVLIRDEFRLHEIPYLTKSVKSKSHQIQLADLMVSIKDDRIYLRSQKLNREIVPCIDNSYNYTRSSLPVYHFLCELSRQNKIPGLFFQWGAIESHFKFLPRVIYKDVILSPSKWNLNLEDINLTISAELNIYNLIEQYKIPNEIKLLNGETELYLNLGNIFDKRILIDTLKKKKEIVLIEALFNTKNPIVKDSAGNSYVNEFIAILENNATNHLNEFNNNIDSQNFHFGSDWVYFKIYCGNQISDSVLKKSIEPLTQKLLSLNLIEQWFFLRYSDPDLHLRLRMKISKKTQLQSITNEVNLSLQEFVNSGQIWKVQIDSYIRETIRYGGERQLNLSENLFYHDSVFLSKLLTTNIANPYWMSALLSIDHFLSCFDLNLQTKLDLMERLHFSFSQEFTISKTFKYHVDQKYRNHKENITHLLAKALGENNDEQLNLLEQRKNNSFLIIEELKPLWNQSDDQLTFMGHHIHMMMNRFFNSHQRKNEFVVYDFLKRFYKSKIAIEKTFRK